MEQLKTLYRSGCICLSMYSILPAPQVDWTEENRSYTLGLLPFIGVIIGLCSWGLYRLLSGFIPSFVAVVLTLLPMVLSGGIHMDGLIDTWDGYCSYASREKKLEILKDPHVGAFGVLGAVGYSLLVFGCYVQVLSNGTMDLLPVAFVISRGVGALCLIWMPSAKGDGLGVTFQQATQRRTATWMLGLWLAGCGCGLWMANPMVCVTIFLAVGVFLLWATALFRKTFGGITGDLTGFVIAMVELVVPLTLAVGGTLL